jgi:hypothetical protein
MTKITNRSHYAHVFDQWAKAPVKLGPQPTDAQLGAVHAFKRVGGKEALGMAMAMRDCGMTSEQMLGASALFDGNPTPCRNTIAKFVTNGLFDRVAAGNGVIKITLTPRGQQWVANKAKGDVAAAADAPKAKGARGTKAPKAKRASKAPKATEAVPVVDATPDAVPVTVTEVPADATVN